MFYIMKVFKMTESEKQAFIKTFENLNLKTMQGGEGEDVIRVFLQCNGVGKCKARHLAAFAKQLVDGLKSW